MDDVWDRVAARLNDLTGRRSVVRVPEGGEWRVVSSVETWPAEVLDGSLRIPVDGGQSLQAEIVLPREKGKGPDPLASPMSRSLIGEVAEATAQLAIASKGLEDALGRERRLDAFTRALVQCPDAPSLHSLIVTTMARAVGAEIGAIALPIGGESVLGVTATYGYPSVVVEHVRQAPGEGILGRVFSTGQAVVVRDVAEQPDHARRRRYRSSSYLAFPIMGPLGVHAVVAVTDKADGEPFDDGDLTVLTSFGTIISPAIMPLPAMSSIPGFLGGVPASGSVPAGANSTSSTPSEGGSPTPGTPTVDTLPPAILPPPNAPPPPDGPPPSGPPPDGPPPNQPPPTIRTPPIDQPPPSDPPSDPPPSDPPHSDPPRSDPPPPDPPGNPTPTPEPGTLILLVGGCGAFVRRLRVRR